jgi:hypothetical protein
VAPRDARPGNAAPSVHDHAHFRVWHCRRKAAAIPKARYYGHAYAANPVFIQTCRDVLLSQARRTGTTLQEDQQNEQTLLRLIQEICSVPLPTEYPTLEAAIHGLEAGNLMAELGEDKEVQELLLRKIRERGQAGKLLTKVS